MASKSRNIFYQNKKQPVTMRRSVRILLVGDRGVGKTSLILSLVSEEFPDDVPHRAEEITIPADVIPEMVPTHIVDYSAYEQTDSELMAEVRRAHVVCVVYSVVEPSTLVRVTTRWLPLIREATATHSTPSPIILVGNKVDLVEETTLESAEEIMEEYPEIESFVECSAKSLKNISEMFYYAQKAVLHPTGPVYITEKQDLTEECKKALTRIFRVCDTDNDGLLNDSELNAFQKRCFDMPLRPEAMEDVKAVLRRNIAGGVSPNNCITLSGRSHTTWTVLRKFGYNEHLYLTKDYLYPPIRVPNGSSTELSHKGQQFLTRLFLRFDKDRDGALSPIELAQLFAVCPAPAWTADVQNVIPTNNKGWITLSGFLCFWNLTALHDLPMMFEYLAYFGYPINEVENQVSAIQVTRERKLDLLKKQSTRNVYECHVIGAHGVGKSTLCRMHLGHTLDKLSEGLPDTPQKTVNIVHVYGQEKFLVMKEVEVRNSAEPLTHRDIRCDVVCLIYDATNPKSFEYVASIYLKYFSDSKVPTLMVCNKKDCVGDVRQDYLVQPGAFCDTHRLAPPHTFLASDPDARQLFQKLATMAAFP
ncbi:hypothetical protein AAG570_010028 [Ranatra chinensis]|uniref:Mitochondrial Rho GTPase n=1 Tax=Ranatra chinensis TaxID=642074 RepID=A0ABD0YLL2_9HEMI